MKTELSLDEIAKLLRRVKLGQIRLLEAHAKLGDVKQGVLPDNAHQAMNLMTTVREKEKSITIDVTYSLNAAYDVIEEIQENAPIFVRGRFSINYIYTGDGDARALVAAVQPAAVMTSWPFWRELVHSLTVRMGLPPFPVRMINMSELIDSSRKEKAGKKRVRNRASNR